jgi:DNA polymerase lambda
LKSGEKLSEDLYLLKLDPQGEGINEPDDSLDPKPTDRSISCEPHQLQNKNIKSSSEDTEIVNLGSNEDRRENEPLSSTSTANSHGEVESLSYTDRRPQHLDAENEAVRYNISLQLKISCFKFFFIQNFPPLSLNRINS